MVLKTLPFLLLYLFCFSCGNEQTKKESTLNSQKIISNIKEQKFSGEVEKKLIEKVNQALKAEENNDNKKAQNYLLEYSELFEVEYSKANIPGTDIQGIKNKYKSLREMKEDFKEEETMMAHGLKGKALKLPTAAFINPFVYHPETLKQVLEVYKDFGRLYINENFTDRGKPRIEEVRSAKTPWSGHWYPYSGNDLYKDKNSPLAKFDKLVTFLVGYDSQARSFQEKMMKGLGGTSWEGLCDAWALASVLTDEPTKSLTVSGVKFSIADQKALLTFSHLKYPFKQYGIQYAGNYKTDGTHDDIKPEAFHRVLLSVLGEQKRAVIIDDMAGVEVWNKPLYRYRWKTVKDPGVKNAYLVTAYPWLIKERTRETSKLTSGKDTIAPTYYYRLYVDKSTVEDGKYLVIAGEWINQSRDSHPDNIKVPHTKGTLGSHNSEFNKNIEVFERYLLNSY